MLAANAQSPTRRNSMSAQYGKIEDFMIRLENNSTTSKLTIKDQTIIGLNEQLIRMEKTLRDYEKRMTHAGLNIKESDAVFTTTKCVMGDRIMIRLDEIEKQMQTLTGKKLREDSKNFKKEQKTAKNL